MLFFVHRYQFQDFNEFYTYSCHMAGWMIDIRFVRIIMDNIFTKFITHLTTFCTLYNQ